MEQPLINILIRTSNRPSLFRRCLRSIERQSYKNVRVIVSYDTFHKPSYIPENIIAVDMMYMIVNVVMNECPAWYNLYCNELKKLVTYGYWCVIDDDDYVLPNQLELIVPHLKEDACNLIQMSRNGRKKPLKPEIVSGKVGMPCFILHSKHKNISNFDGSTNADYKFIKEVSEVLGINWIEKVLVTCDRRSYGR